MFNTGEVPSRYRYFSNIASKFSSRHPTHTKKEKKKTAVGLVQKSAGEPAVCFWHPVGPAHTTHLAENVGDTSFLAASCPQCPRFSNATILAVVRKRCTYSGLLSNRMSEQGACFHDHAHACGHASLDLDACLAQPYACKDTEVNVDTYHDSNNADED
ncbi:hypothetical protein BaRGS_00021505 [Batillaria attramentaria]|uniref:Uncharacterized protein n=1 Tax=Batillaria attramentaria TaxID=370345 RepID=A0ABD0KJM3_9CAEN